jgi:hypothetical protein
MAIRSPAYSRPVTIVALLLLASVLTPAPALGGGMFGDDDGNVHEPNIEAIAIAGITFGCDPDGGEYCPDSLVTRGQMASFLARAFALPPAGHDMFDDDSTSVHEDNIDRVGAALIAQGFPDGTFRPDTHVTRAQMASFLARAMGLEPLPVGPFVDTDGTHAANINAIANAGVTIGCTTGGSFYCPDDTVRRDQMASFLARALGLEPPTDLVVNEYFAGLPGWGQFLEDIGTPPLDDFDGRTPETASDVVTEYVADAQYDCEVTPYTLTANPREIVTFDPDSNILWTGALLQGRGYVDGIGSLQELPIRQRAPMVISLDLLTSDNMRVVENPTVATVGQAVGELIALAESRGLRPAGSVFYEKEESHSVEQSALDLGLSARYMGGSVESTLSIDRKANEHTITAYFVERAFTVSMVLPQEPGDVFSDDFTTEVLEAQENLGRIGPTNLPVYIANVTYGRILMFSMTSTANVSDMEATLNAAYAGGSFGAEADLSIDQKDLLQNARIQVVTVGGNSSNALALIRSGELGAYFGETADLSSYRPISYSVRNLGDNSIAKVSETTDYNIKECTAIVPGLEDVGDKVKITLDHVEVHDAGDGSTERGELYGRFEVDGNVVWDRPRDAAMSFASGSSFWFDTGINTYTLDFLEGGGKTVYIDGHLIDADGGLRYEDDTIGDWEIKIEEPVEYGRFDARSGTATLVYRVENVGNIYEPNQAPEIEAGADLVAEIPAGSTEIQVPLNPDPATDDGYPDGATITYAWSVDEQPAAATVTFEPQTGTTPASTVTLDAPGIYVLRITASDSKLSGSDTLRVTVTQGVNTPPEATAPTATTTADTPIVITLSGFDADGHSLTWEIVDPASSGTLDPTSGDDASWDITYTPSPGFTGDDQFSYTVSDGVDTSGEATVAITVEVP